MMHSGTTRTSNDDRPFVIVFVQENTLAQTATAPLYVRRDSTSVLVTDLAPYVWQPRTELSLGLEDLGRKRAASKQAHLQVVQQARSVRPTSIAARARFGFQQIARLPCYRGTRTR